MAITKETTVRAVVVRAPADATAANTDNAYWPTLKVDYQNKYDDSADTELPVYHYINEVLSKFNSDGTAFDYSGKDAMVKKIAAAVWA